MAINSRPSTELLIPKKWPDREDSPERTKIWIDQKAKTDHKVPVIYSLSRNGHLEHPHFIEVSPSSAEGLYLRDVMNRLNFLRGRGMASMYSWSSKQSYKNGFVWQDLSENDLIYPTHGSEYVVKGSELLQSSLSFRYYEATGSSENLPDTKNSADDCNFPAIIRRRNQSWSSIDSHEYRVYKAESNGELAGKTADASTQTEEVRRRRRSVGKEREERNGETITELSREEISPPVSNSSSEALEGSRDVDRSADILDRTASNERPSERMKASQVLMQMITCGSVSVDNWKSIKSKENGGYSMRVEHGERVRREALDR
uniref:SOSEKI DIX-like domain-containing protein n=1 Tax=Davidia involucrata TaxID=16924 RepID=A0A5B6YXG3_DAVIN